PAPIRAEPGFGRHTISAGRARGMEVDELVGAGEDVPHEYVVAGVAFAVRAGGNEISRRGASESQEISVAADRNRRIAESHRQKAAEVASRCHKNVALGQAIES